MGQEHEELVSKSLLSVESPKLSDSIKLTLITVFPDRTDTRVVFAACSCEQDAVEECLLRNLLSSDFISASFQVTTERQTAEFN